jgi:hypothetical protein
MQTLPVRIGNGGERVFKFDHNAQMAALDPSRRLAATL